MIATLSLYKTAERRSIPICCVPLPLCGSLAFKDDAGQCYIGIDDSLVTTSDQERVHLAHEIGHCVRGAFYNRYSPFDLRQQQENRADRWAIRKLIPKSELDTAVARGYTELWELAEQFNVTEDFMRKAICFYEHGNLSPDLYL